MEQQNKNETLIISNGLLSLSQCLSSLVIQCTGMTDENAQKELQSAFNELKASAKRVYSIIHQNALCMSFDQRLQNSITAMQNNPMMMYNFWF